MTQKSRLKQARNISLLSLPLLLVFSAIGGGEIEVVAEKSGILEYTIFFLCLLAFALPFLQIAVWLKNTKEADVKWVKKQSELGEIGTDTHEEHKEIIATISEEISSLERRRLYALVGVIVSISLFAWLVNNAYKTWDMFAVFSIGIFSPLLLLSLVFLIGASRMENRISTIKKETQKKSL